MISRTIQYHPSSYDTTNQAPRRVIARLGNVFFSLLCWMARDKGLDLGPGTDMQRAKVPTDLFSRYKVAGCVLVFKGVQITYIGWLVVPNYIRREAKAKQKIILDSVYFDESHLKNLRSCIACLVTSTSDTHIGDVRHVVMPLKIDVEA